MAERKAPRPRLSSVPKAPTTDLKAAPKSSATDLVPIPKPKTPVRVSDAARRSDVDEWGRSETMRKIARTLYDPVYSHWFRAEWEGFERIPREGGALLVANHAGAIPSDAPVIMHGVEKELGRPVYGLAENLFRSLPVVGMFWSRLGGVNAHPDNAYRLLREQNELVLVFPEGVKGVSKNVRRRYQLARFGRGGFVEIAMRAGVPIIPIAILGNEETAPVLWKIPSAAKALGIPYFPVTPQMLAVGPLGAAIPFPAKFRLQVLEPVHIDVPPDQDRYSQSHVMAVAENIRDRIQNAVWQMVSERRDWIRG